MELNIQGDPIDGVIDGSGVLYIYTPQRATLVYVPHYIREYVRSIQPERPQHPRATTQGYDFFCNLDMFGGK